MYENMITNAVLAGLYEDNAKQLGVNIEHDSKTIPPIGVSTDMGNVSHVVPCLQPFFRLNTSAANHSRPFADAAGMCQITCYLIFIYAVRFGLVENRSLVCFLYLYKHKSQMFTKS